MLIFVDIDGTVALTEKDRNYKKSKPIKSRINKINSLYDQGHTIVYHTARGAMTGNNYFQETYQFLINSGAKFHELRMWKPPYDLLIDDKAINADVYFQGVYE